jgi:nucleotide-binding universal stress UspA family protein
MNEIVVGVDDSATAREAARQAVEMANNYQRGVHIVMALTRTSASELRVGGGETFHFDTISAADNSLKALAGELGARVPVTTAVVRADPATALCDEATRLEASVIVVGNKRVQGASRILGSIALDVAKAAPCNVLIVHTF